MKHTAFPPPSASHVKQSTPALFTMKHQALRRNARRLHETSLRVATAFPSRINRYTAFRPDAMSRASRRFELAVPGRQMAAHGRLRLSRRDCRWFAIKNGAASSLITGTITEATLRRLNSGYLTPPLLNAESAVPQAQPTERASEAPVIHRLI